MLGGSAYCWNQTSISPNVHAAPLRTLPPAVDQDVGRSVERNDGAVAAVVAGQRRGCLVAKQPGRPQAERRKEGGNAIHSPSRCQSSVGRDFCIERESDARGERCAPCWSIQEIIMTALNGESVAFRSTIFRFRPNRHLYTVLDDPLSSIRRQLNGKRRLLGLGHCAGLKSGG